jgi:dihydropteroate synthase
MKKTLNLGGRILDLSEPKIMGIVNLTPDSFFEGSRALDSYKYKIEGMVKDKVDILDLGAYSTRPGASVISIQEEIDRLLPVLEFSKSNFSDIPVSIDTFRSEVVKASLGYGSIIVNDVSGGDLDSQMWTTVADLGLPYILMHMRGDPSNMQSSQHLTYDDVVLEITQVLQEKVYKLKTLGVLNIIIDPGIGFAKKVESNFEIIKNLGFFKNLNCPILIGISRKSFISKSLNVPVEQTLIGTTALHSVALLNGANILRVHDVNEAVQVKRLLKKGNF